VKLIDTGKRKRPRACAMSRNGQFESAARKQFEELRKDGSALIHRRMLLATPAKASPKRLMKMKSCTLTTLQTGLKNRIDIA
jgi:hypothetical protein